MLLSRGRREVRRLGGCWVALRCPLGLNLMHSEFLVLRADLANISSLWVEANDNIENILDMYDTRPVRSDMDILGEIC